MLGGNSLKAINLGAAARESGLALTFGQIFQFPTLADMASQMRENVQAGDVVEAWELISESLREEIEVEIEKQCGEIVVEDAYPSTPEQDRMLRESNIPGRQRAMVCSEVYEIDPSIDITQLRKAFEIVIQTYPNFRTRIIDVGGKSVQVVLKESIDWVADVQEDGIAVLQPGFGRDLLAMSIIDRDGKKFFTWSLHHSLLDGWSLRLFWEAVVSAYSHDSVPESTPFNRLIKFMTNTDHSATESFWKSYLRGARPSTLLKLPDAYIPFQTGKSC